MHFGDSIFIFLLALVLFGPKKLPEIGRTIGKLLAEFRRASNEFKFQIQEELRTMEDDERRKKLAEQQAQKAAAEALPAPDSSTSATTTPSILPPSSGTQVSTGAPYATPAEPAEPTPVSNDVTPSAAEVIVEPTTSTPVDPTPSSPSHVDLNANTNGAHTVESAASVEPVESIVPGEPVKHG
jgi:sec-independent protein translocase protein TatB